MNWKFGIKIYIGTSHRLLRLSSIQNNSSMLVESGCIELESLGDEVSFPRENFHFLRFDSCLAVSQE